MVVKKLLFLCLIIACKVITPSYTMLREIKIIKADKDDTSIIKEAAFFKIHEHKYCYSYENKTKIGCNTQIISCFFESDASVCQEGTLLPHDKNTIVATYHDKNWGVIAFMDISQLQLNPEERLDYLIARIDLDTKPIAVKAKIKTCRICNAPAHHSTIKFYDKYNKCILQAQCPKKYLYTTVSRNDKIPKVMLNDEILLEDPEINLDGDDTSKTDHNYNLEKFRYYLDLRKNVSIEDCRQTNDNNCIIS